MTVERDENGRIRVNGFFGSFVEWLRFLMPVLIIPLTLWGVSIEVRFQRIQNFMELGERFTRTDWEREQATLQLKVLEKLQTGPLDRLYRLPEKFPPQDYRDRIDARFEALEKQLDRVQDDVQAVRHILESQP